LKVLVGKYEDKRQDGITTHRLWNNIKMDLKEVGLEGFGQRHLSAELDK
jgi:hypothetical protein